MRQFNLHFYQKVLVSREKCPYIDFDNEKRGKKMTDQNLLNIRQVADRLRMGRPGVVDLIESGELPAIKLPNPGGSSRRYRVTETALAEFIRRNEIGGRL
jgi:excisionase family DNA binding protein